MHWRIQDFESPATASLSSSSGRTGRRLEEHRDELRAREDLYGPQTRSSNVRHLGTGRERDAEARSAQSFQYVDMDAEAQRPWEAGW